MKSLQNCVCRIEIECLFNDTGHGPSISSHIVTRTFSAPLIWIRRLNSIQLASHGCDMTLLTLPGSLPTLPLIYFNLWLSLRCSLSSSLTYLILVSRSLDSQAHAADRDLTGNRHPSVRLSYRFVFRPRRRWTESLTRAPAKSPIGFEKCPQVWWYFMNKVWT